MSPDGVPHVAVTGWSWTTIMVTLLNLLVGGGLVAWIKLRPKMRELAQSEQDKLIEHLSGRVEMLERRLDDERVRHQGEVQLMRHRLNNSDQCLDALLLLLKTAPDKVADAVSHIEAMRARQRETEAIEKAALITAPIQAPTSN